MKPLVAYSDSEEEADGSSGQPEDYLGPEQLRSKTEIKKDPFQAFSVSNDREFERLPALGWEKSTYENGWLCHVYIPVSLTSQFHSMLRQDMPDGWHYIIDQAALHISLTRPIVLQRHETQSLLKEVRDAVKLSGISQFVVGFARFSCFASDTSSRIFLSLETSSGWNSMQQLTQILSRKLKALMSVQEYYEQPRFHVSFAYREADSCDQRQNVLRQGYKIAETLNQSLGRALQRQPSIYANAVAVQMGHAIDYVGIPPSRPT